MAGIRVNNPTGPGWSHSLNATDWQDDPKFAEFAPGVPFVVGNVYNVVSRHSASGAMMVSSILFGQPHNEGLYWLTKDGGNWTNDGIIADRFYSWFFGGQGAVDKTTMFPAIQRTLKDGNGKDIIVNDYTDWGVFLQSLADFAPATTLNHLFIKLYSAATDAAKLGFINALPDVAITRLCERLAAVGCGTGGSTTPPTSTPYSVGDLYVRKPKVSVPTGPPIIGGTYSGSLDVGQCDLVTGWAVNRSSLASSISVDIKYRRAGTTDALQLADTVPANRARPDVATEFSSSFDKYGFQLTVPASYRKGSALEWHAFIAGTTYELTFSPRTSSVCPDETPTVVSRYINKSAANATEGGAAVQCTLMERLSNGGGERPYPDAAAVAWSTVGAAAGIGFSSSNRGQFMAAVNSVTGNTFVQIHASVPEGVTVDQIEVLEAGCSRPTSGLSNFYLAWNFTAQFGGAFHAFADLDDANNTVGGVFDGTNPGQLSTFPVQIENLTVGKDVFLGLGTDCGRASGVALAVLDAVAGNTIKKAIRIVDGKIAEIKSSTYQGPNLINVAAGKAVTAPANTLGAGWVPSNLTDNNPATNYSTDCVATNQAVTITIDLAGYARPWFVKILPRQDDPGAMPTDYIVEGSYGGTSWERMATVTNQARGAGEIVLQAFRNAQGQYSQYRYVRLVTSKNAAAAADCTRVQLAEIKVMAPELLPLPTPPAPAADPAVDRIDVKWVRNSPQNPNATNRLYLYVRTTNAADALTIRWESSNGAGSGTASMVALSNDPQGCQWGFDLNWFAGAELTFYFTPKRAGTSYFEQPAGYVVPMGATTERANLYPGI